MPRHRWQWSFTCAGTCVFLVVFLWRQRAAGELPRYASESSFLSELSLTPRDSSRAFSDEPESDNLRPSSKGTGISGDHALPPSHRYEVLRGLGWCVSVRVWSVMYGE